MRKIPLIKPFVNNSVFPAVKKVLDSGMLTDGLVTREFERKVCDYVGIQYGMANPNCALALELSLKALKIKKDDEIIIPDYTHPATINAVISAGGKPVLVDVDMDTYNISLSAADEAVSEKTKAIMPVSLFGQPVNIEKLISMKKEHDFSIVEDAACSLGAEYKGFRAGKLSDITCFSFHPRKILSTGEGGMLVTKSKEIFDIAKQMKMFGGRLIPGTKIFEYYELGGNYKFPNILAAMGIEQLALLDNVIDDRIKKAHKYIDLLKETEGIECPKEIPDTKHTFQSFCCLLSKDIDRNKLILNLKRDGIESQIGSYCLSIQPVFKNIKRGGELINSKDIFNRALVLPLYHSMTENDQMYVVEKLKKEIKSLI
ncbi:aminotransferase class I/II-fold pyridoxal phosphate-dependent enzyme [Candidatus Woesearchaeota archaeon]|nr:aminotransferase class I/II-fold pyridoxal phosphate-dependent enzyme [Candidatus Woesearchaeota archaeon]